MKEEYTLTFETPHTDTKIHFGTWDEAKQYGKAVLANTRYYHQDNFNDPGIYINGVLIGIQGQEGK